MIQEQDKKPFEDSEIDEIAITILSRIKDLTFGEHKSIFTGLGFDFSGLREWQPGDRQVSVDWAHSTHTGFSPLIVRECVEERSIDVWVVADNSLSVRCGINGETLSDIVSRAIAIIGLSGVVFQDRIGLIAFDGNNYLVEPPRGGKKQIYQLLDLYRQPKRSYLIPINKESIAEVISSNLRRISMVVVVSDFLFLEAESVIKELIDIRSEHDIFLVMIDASFPFEIEPFSDGWISGVDIETGEARLLSSDEFKKLGQRVRTHQKELELFSEKHGLEIVNTGTNKDDLAGILADFFLIRRTQWK